MFYSSVLFSEQQNELRCESSKSHTGYKTTEFDNFHNREIREKTHRLRNDYVSDLDSKMRKT